MKKQTKIIIAVVAVIAVIAIIFAIVRISNAGKSKIGKVKDVNDLTSILDKIYEGQEDNLPDLDSYTVDLTNKNAVNSATGLENGDDFEFIVVSEPLMSSQAYSLVLGKVKTGVDANAIAKQMLESVNTSKWICVTADKVYATNSGDVVFLVMASEERAKPVYENFKALAGKIGEEYERTAEEYNLSEDILNQSVE